MTANAATPPPPPPRGKATTPGTGPAAILGRHDLAITDLDVFKVTGPPSGYPANMRTFYSPEDHVPQALQVRTQVVNSDLTADFRRWYPGFTHRGGPVEPAA